MNVLTENEISYLIRGAIFKIYNELGPGLLESVYEVLLEFELKKQGLDVKKQVPLPVYYENNILEIGFRLDLLINNKVIIEIKSVENLTKVHHKQLLTYLKISELKLGILVNFNVEDISKAIFRKVNNL
ncbi:GxxExxY protein [Mariniflexile ostreae]|uniref:GxxExxY protein n=1 Tax=Mariniflexile ostreae TaxID=1520892 RepID=A0ABV5FAE3_9FLAO